jgi:voltage-gated potassium channel
MPQSYAFDEAISRQRSPAVQLLIALVALAGLTILGTAGYVLIEGMAFIDALYMTVITLSTVGYGETVPLSEIGRLYTIGLIVLGLGTVFYAVGTLASFLIEGRLRQILGRRTMKRAITALHDHVIVCGFGRLGHAVSEYLRLGGTSVVVIDSDPAVQEKCDAMGCLFVLGSALEDAALAEAGIERARTRSSRPTGSAASASRTPSSGRASSSSSSFPRPETERTSIWRRSCCGQTAFS